MNILDSRFKYTPACATDIRVTFAKARADMAKAKPKAPAIPIKRGAK